MQKNQKLLANYSSIYSSIYASIYSSIYSSIHSSIYYLLSLPFDSSNIIVKPTSDLLKPWKSKPTTSSPGRRVLGR